MTIHPDLAYQLATSHHGDLLREARRSRRSRIDLEPIEVRPQPRRPRARRGLLILARLRPAQPA
jgi:hypothetical protein